MCLQEKKAEVNNEGEGMKQRRKTTFFFLFNGGGKKPNTQLGPSYICYSCLLVCNVCSWQEINKI